LSEIKNLDLGLANHIRVVPVKEKK
jgi:hypothetical protein